MNVTGLLDDENFSTDFGKFLGKSITIIFEENKQTLSKTLTETLNFILQDIIKHRRLFHDDEEYVSISTKFDSDATTFSLYFIKRVTGKFYI